MIDTDKYEGHTPADQWTTYKMGADKPYHAVRFGGRGLDLELKFGADAQLIADAPKLLADVKRLREDYENMSEVLRENGMDICRHCRVIYRDDDMNHPHYPSLHPWHMDGMCMKEMKE